MSKKKGFISFSGGETSGRMLKWLLENKSDEFDFKILFANTGRENNETLDFVEKCSKLFGVEVLWVEAVFGKGLRVAKGEKHRIVTYKTATRNQDWKYRDDTPYEEMVKQYGIANISAKHSTRELKLRPMTSYLRSIGWKKGEYYTFIGIRSDEVDRVSKDRKEEKIIYPLIEYVELSKAHVNFWWNLQPFRLQLKGWEGNCVTCYKKSVKKLAKIMQDDPWKFEFDAYLEERYGYYIPEGKLKSLKARGASLPDLPLRIYRGGKSVEDVKLLALEDIDVEDDALLEDESCDVYSNCGDLL